MGKRINFSVVLARLRYPASSGPWCGAQMRIRLSLDIYCWPRVYGTHTLWLLNIAIEHGRFIDGLSIEKGDFPWHHCPLICIYTLVNCDNITFLFKSLFWLVVSNIFSYMGSSFPLTNSYFSRWLKHVKTTNQLFLVVSYHQLYTMLSLDIYYWPRVYGRHIHS